MRPTLEIVLSESPAHLRKRYDPTSGLTLIALDAENGSALQGETSLPPVLDVGDDSPLVPALIRAAERG